MENETSFIINGQSFSIAQQTNYPWAGKISFTISTDQPVEFDLKLRIPGWADNQPVPGDLYAYISADEDPVQVMLNNEPLEIQTGKGYCTVSKNWKNGDKVELILPMKTRKVVPHKNIKELQGKIAVERGPLVYCAEQADNPGGTLNKSVLAETDFDATYEPNELQGVVKLKSDNGMTLVPYYSWNHRGLGEMAVWFDLQ